MTESGTWTEASAVFEINGWAVCHTTRLWASSYTIAVRRGSDHEVITIGGRDNEPLAHLLMRFDPTLLDQMRAALKHDRGVCEDEEDPAVRAEDEANWRFRENEIRKIEADIARDQSDPEWVPVPVLYEEGRKTWDSVSPHTGRLLSPPEMLATISQLA